MRKSEAYIKNVQKLVDGVLTEQLENIDRCAELFARTLEADRNIFLFGTGHSHMLAEEIFYRAGGLVKVRPVLEEPLMLHDSAYKSTQIERLTGYASVLFEHYDMKKDDVIVIISNSGRNGVCVDMAELAKKEGLNVIALTNMNHTLSSESRHPSGKKLYEFADIVLDNMGCTGDSSVEIDGFNRKVAPTSTVIGAMILNAIVAQTVQNIVDDGFEPEVFSSSNVDGGDAVNERYIRKYKGDIKSL